MSECLQRRVKLRSTFRITRRTLWDRLYMRGLSSSRGGTWFRDAEARLARFLYLRAGRSLGARYGEAKVAVDDEWRPFRYNAFNTQFHSLYKPEYSRGYEPETAALLQILLRSSRCFFDIGSNWGYFSVLAAANGFKGEIRAFELQPEVHADLRQVVNEAGFDSAIQCENVGLSDQRGRSGVHISDGLHSGIGQMAVGDTVEVRTLDDYIESKPDLLKIDVEGAEALVLRGGNEVLRQCRPWIIFESWCNRADIRTGLEPLYELAKHDYLFYQPVLIKDASPYAAYHTYGEYWDVEENMMLRLVPFTIEQRQLMQRQFNVLACPVDRLAGLESLFKV